MRIFYVLITAMIISYGSLHAQRACFSASYLEEQLQKNPQLQQQVDQVEEFIRQRTGIPEFMREQGQGIIRIPVVFHILYHSPAENIPDEKVYEQIAILNESFRRRNADTVKTPAAFRPVAADCGIEFVLATSDPRQHSTTGIVRKYTPIGQWLEMDEMKFSSRMGTDGWDPSAYLNIWVCNMKGIAGYASWPGGEPEKDGLVINYKYVGRTTIGGFEEGKVTVHETGHWLGLKHIWGDANCGDDLVDDTPKQAFYNTGCPTGIRITCGNGPTGDMYMNYMDYTHDRCINLFTEGQRARMRTLFAPGGSRYALLSSPALNPPLYQEAPVPEESPRWLYTRVYPNPATTSITIDVSYDPRWLGKYLSVTNTNGQALMQVPITSKIQDINISLLRPGIYFLSSKKEDGAVIRFKFVKV